MPRRDCIAEKLPSKMLQALRELNLECLELLAAQSRAVSRRDFPLGEAIALWNGFDSEARSRAVDYPYLLFNAGFADPQRWRQTTKAQVNEDRDEPYETFFTVPGAVQVAHEIFVHAWSAVREHPTNAMLTLGMHPQCAKLIAAHTPVSLHRAVERHWSWLRPRWLDRPQIWQELLLGGLEGGETRARAFVHGLRLVTAEIAAATQKRDKRFVG
jgi:hypothetical protein